MDLNVKTITEYLKEVADEMKETFNRLREIIVKNLPDGLHEKISYGLTVRYPQLYPEGHHCTPACPYLLSV